MYSADRLLHTAVQSLITRAMSLKTHLNVMAILKLRITHNHVRLIGALGLGGKERDLGGGERKVVDVEVFLRIKARRCGIRASAHSHRAATLEHPTLAHL